MQFTAWSGTTSYTDELVATLCSNIIPRKQDCDETKLIRICVVSETQCAADKLLGFLARYVAKFLATLYATTWGSAFFRGVIRCVFTTFSNTRNHVLESDNGFFSATYFRSPRKQHN